MLVARKDIKSYMNLAADSHDTIIDNLITQNDALVKGYCGRDFEVTSYTEYHDGDGTDKIVLRNYPVSTITSIHDDVDRNYDSSTLISSDYYMVETDSGIVKLDSLFSSIGKRNIKVIYSAGYSAANIPADLKLAVLKLVVADYIEAVANINAAVSDEIIYKPDKLRKEAYKILDRYKKLL